MPESPLFPGQGEDERVIIFERRHWYVLIEWLKAPFALLFISLLIALVANWFLPLSVIHRILSWTLMPLLVALWSTWRVLNWENDRYIVTDKRAIHIEKVYFIREKRDEAPLNMIQDISVEIRGLARNLLCFGNVVIQTAGTLGTIRFTGIRNPHNVQAQMLALTAQAKWGTMGGETVGSTPEMAGLRLKETPLESESPKRNRILTVIKEMFFTDTSFGENQVVWRKHWWVLLKAIILPSLSFAFLFAIWLLASNFIEPILCLDIPFAILSALVFLWFAWTVIDWRNDIYVITDERVVDVEKIPLIYEHKREASLEKIQDVRYLQEGFIAKALDFGNVRLETAGEMGEFTFDFVPHPREVQIEIFGRLKGFRRRRLQEERERMRREILNVLSRMEERS